MHLDGMAATAMTLDISADAPRVLLINANPFFANALAFTASRRNTALECWDGLGDTIDRIIASDYDVIVMDLALGVGVAATELASLLGKPVVFTADGTPSFAEASAWPANVRRFVSKARGIEAILDAALELVN